jgi:membrane protease subunit HflK
MDIEKQIREFTPSNVSLNGRWVAIIIVVVGLLVAVWSTFFQVGADSVGIVLRFGEPVREAGPGLHMKMPFGIEEVRKVPTQRQQKLEFGYRTRSAGVDTQYSEGGYERESLMLTGDLNVVDVEWAVQYRISDPSNYLFEVRNVQDTFRFMSQAVMREVVGDRTVNEVLTVGRAELAGSVKQKLQQLSDDYTMGVRVEQVNLQDIAPPDPVKPSFNEVNEAQQERSRLINEAKADYNKAVPAARGEAQRKIQQAEGYAIDRVNRAEGEVARFNSMLKEYEQAPDVTRRRIYIETMGEVLPKVKRKMILDSDTTDIVPLLNLDKTGALKQ